MSLVEYGYDSGEEEEIMEIAKIPQEVDKPTCLAAFSYISRNRNELFESSSLCSVSNSSINDNNSNFNASEKISNHTFPNPHSLLSVASSCLNTQSSNSSSFFYSDSDSLTSSSNQTVKNDKSKLFSSSSSSSSSLNFFQNASSSSSSGFFSSKASAPSPLNSCFSSPFSLADSLNFSFSHLSEESQNLMPILPNVAVDEQLQKHLDKLIEFQKKGTTVNKNIQKWLQFKNPYLLDKIMSIFNIDGYSSNFPSDKFDPCMFKKQNAYFTYEILAKKQAELYSKSKRNLQAKKAENEKEENEKKKKSRFASKWDIQGEQLNNSSKGDSATLKMNSSNLDFCLNGSNNSSTDNINCRNSSSNIAISDHRSAFTNLSKEDLVQISSQTDMVGHLRNEEEKEVEEIGRKESNKRKLTRLKEEKRIGDLSEEEHVKQKEYESERIVKQMKFSVSINNNNESIHNVYSNSSIVDINKSCMDINNFSSNATGNVSAFALSLPHTNRRREEKEIISRISVSRRSRNYDSKRKKEILEEEEERVYYNSNASPRKEKDYFVKQDGGEGMKKSVLEDEERKEEKRKLECSASIIYKKEKENEVRSDAQDYCYKRASGAAKDKHYEDFPHKSRRKFFVSSTLNDKHKTHN